MKGDPNYEAMQPIRRAALSFRPVIGRSGMPISDQHRPAGDWQE